MFAGKQYRRSAIAVTLWLVGTPAWAAEQADQSLPELGILEDFPVVLSASRLSQPLSEAPNAMTVIDRGMIEASGFRSIADLFRLVPGMYVGALDGHTPIVAYHGATDQYSRRMQVLIDGRSVYLPPLSSVDWEDIPIHIDDIERIEVVRGPAAASYGANSLNGVINIITRDAGSVNGASVSVTRGQEGIADVAAHAGHSGEVLDYRMTLAYRSDNGLGTPILNDGSASQIVNLRSNYHPNGVDSFDIQLGYNKGVRSRGIDNRPQDPFHDTYSYSNFQQVKWQHTLDQGNDLSLNYYHIHRDSADTQAPGNTQVERQELELQHTLQLGNANRLVWGGGVRTDFVDSPMNLLASQSLNQSRIFMHDEWRATPAAILNAGAMYENDGMGHYNTSPRIALNYHLNSQHTFRIGASVAYRSPATVEEYGNSSSQGTPPAWLSLGGLRPERVLSREVGYLGEILPARLSVDARLYSDQISDIIFIDPLYWSPSGTTYSFANLLAADVRGFETTVKFRWSERGSVIFNYARQMMDCTITGTLTLPVLTPLLQQVANECTPSVPWNSGSILLSQQLADGYQFSLGYYYRSEMQMIETQAPEGRMQRVDMRLAKRIGGMRVNEGGEIAAVIQNLFQDDYTNYTAVPETQGITFNRRVFVTATYHF